MKSLVERLAWLAGIIDGEGSLSATLAKTRKSRFVRYDVRVVNTDEGMIVEVVSICDTLGVKCFTGIQESRRPNERPVYRIRIDGRRHVLRLLESVLPWLITKKPRAELVIAMVRRSFAGRGAIHYDPVLRSQLDELRVLNQRGFRPVRPVFTRRKSMLYDVVGAEGDENIPTGQPEPSTAREM